MMLPRNHLSLSSSACSFFSHAWNQNSELGALKQPISSPWHEAQQGHSVIANVLFFILVDVAWVLFVSCILEAQDAAKQSSLRQARFGPCITKFISLSVEKRSGKSIRPLFFFFVKALSSFCTALLAPETYRHETRGKGGGEGEGAEKKRISSCFFYLILLFLLCAFLPKKGASSSS